MGQQLSQLLAQLIEMETAALRAFPDAAAGIRPSGETSWSPKEELGHLIDSAANNHIRFIRAVIQTEYRGDSYAQNDWVRAHAYQEMEWNTIVSFWLQFNTLLVWVVAQTPDEKLQTLCFVGSGDPVTLGFLIDDYILHMQHHLDHLLGRETVTPYPRPKSALR